MDLEPLTLPAEPSAPRRPSLPLLAALVPVAAGVVLWLVTGSLLSLCFAAIGPLMIVASLVDGLRTRRRDRRESEAIAADAWRRAERELERRHEHERADLRRVHPDAAECLREPPLRAARPVDQDTAVVLGAGTRRSALRVDGGEGERAREFRARCSTLEAAPIAVPVGRGVVIRAPVPVGAAVARALLIQLCLRHTPGQLVLTGTGLAALGVERFPHVRPARRGAWQIAVHVEEGDDGEDRGALAHAGDASAELRVVRPGADVPAGITTVIDCVDPLHAQVRTPDGVQQLALECFSYAQAAAIAAAAGERAGQADGLPERLGLDQLAPATDGPGLSATIGRGERAEMRVDLVEDGPHAIVAGMTGVGKSELLVTWVTAMASAHSPDRVVFVLADFKGGTAFDPLRALPHVAAVITDLDDDGARRGVESLSAELRRREGVLAEVGARSVADPRVRIPRLVIVVDEFAALLQEHPDLSAVFVDIAARGRALGMHLILGTQRAAGVVREALAANCPLRVSLRVTDPADSRLVIGADDAAGLPGGPESRGLALVRRPQDAEPGLVRIALTGAADLRRVRSRWPDAVTAPSPWLPPLPALLPLAGLSSGPGDEGRPSSHVPGSSAGEVLAGAGPADTVSTGPGPAGGGAIGTVPAGGGAIGTVPAGGGAIGTVPAGGGAIGTIPTGGGAIGTIPAGGAALVLGRADEPERQRQPLVTLRPGQDRGMAVIGAAGSGRSTVLRVLAAQDPGAFLVPADPEHAWDAVTSLAEPGARVPRLLLCDDVDRIVALFPPDHAQAFLERMEQLVRAGGAAGCTVVLTAGRLSGAVARVVDAVPARLLLRTGTKMEHLAAGGEPDGFRRDRPPGRGVLDGREIQVAWVDPAEELHVSLPPPSWTPAAALTGVVCRGARRTLEALRSAHPHCDVVPVGDAATRVAAVHGPAAVPSDGRAAAPIPGERPRRIRGEGFSPLVLVGDAETWQRQWSLWQQVREEGEVLVLADCAVELRSLAGIRELPPYARPNAGRAWSLGAGGGMRRVLIPGLLPGAAP